MKFKNNLFRSGTVLVVSLLFFVCICRGQVEPFRLPGKLNFSLTPKQIAADILSDTTLHVFSDTFDLEDSENPLWMTYKTNSGSIDIVFIEKHLSSVDILTNDSCYFNYVKVFCYENYTASTKTKKPLRKWFSNKQYRILLESYKSAPKYRILIRSKKYAIKM